MAKKRKRPASSDSKESDFTWQKVNVGLLAPSKASATAHSSDKKDDDFENGKNNHYDNPTSSVYRNADRDLEAAPQEGVGFFYGLEVINDYDVVEKDGHKLIVPKTLPKKIINTKAKSKDTGGEREESKVDSAAVTEKKTSDEAVSGQNKKKKKKKKRKKKPNADAAEGSSDAVESNNSKKNKTTPTIPDTLPKVTEEKSDVIADDDPRVESLQRSWLDATGGVALKYTLCKSLLAQDFWNPTPIQAASLPAAILGRRNIVGAAPTGSGKTLAYLLPIFEFLLQQQEPTFEDRKIQALILAPTRELAMQVQGECDKLVKGKCGILVGGLAPQKQERVLRKNRPPIIIATPGRLWDMISSRNYDHLNDLSQIAFLVIDECDRMTEQGSFPQLHSILDAVEKANPMDEGQDDSDGDDSADEMEDEDRLLSLPGIKGESKVAMLSDDLLAKMEEQRSGKVAPKRLEVEDSQSQDEDEEGAGDEADVSLPSRSPVYRQTFVYSATLTLPPSASYIPSRNRRKKMYKLKGLEGAIAEILEKARARGQTKVIDLSNSKKQAKVNENILDSTEKSGGAKNKDTRGDAAIKPRKTFNLPPGLKLQEIQCTQMHKDSHLYAYLVTTKEGSAGPCLIFCNSIKAVKRVGNTLKTLGLPVRMLHAQLQQRARFRAVESLQSDKRAIVVATDVAARGLDIPSVATVVHYDVARKVDGFVHRAGRTARGMGEKAVGSSVSLISPAEDKAHRKIEGELNATFYRVNLDSKLLAAAQERANLASKVISAEKIEGQAQRDNQWFRQSAEEAGLEIDGDMLDGGLAGGTLKEQQQFKEAQRAKVILRRLLAEPMVTQRYGKFLSVNTAARTPEVAPYVVQAKQGQHPKKKRKSK